MEGVLQWSIHIHTHTHTHKYIHTPTYINSKCILCYFA